VILSSSKKGVQSKFGLSALLLARPFALYFLVIASPVLVLAQIGPAAAPQTSYLYFQQTKALKTYGTAPEEYQQVVRGVQDYLRTNRVATVMEGNILLLNTDLPLSALQSMFRDSGAAYLLHIIVDRPLAKWLKVTVQCYDREGKEIWKEEASVGGGLTGKNAVRDTLNKLKEELDRRLGQPGLFQENSGPPLEVNPSTEPQVAPANGHEDSPSTLKLADGTPVHLLLAQSISSKTAKAGDTVKLRVYGDVKVGDLLVIANKAPATATIETAESAGRAWRRGSLLLKLGTVTLLLQQQQPLRAWSSVKGNDTEAGVEWANAALQTYGFALLFLPLAPLQHGNEAVIPSGAQIDAVISGDVLLQRDAIAAAQPKPAEPRHGPAAVTFYYPDLGGGPHIDIWCGTVKVGKLERGGKFTLTLPGGEYWLRLWNGKNSPMAMLNIEDGGEQYVRAGWLSRRSEGYMTAYREEIVTVSHDIGEAESADTMTEKSRNVQDPAKLDLAELQANPHAKVK